jgi:lysophospholipase L1-like esterase
VFAGISLAFAPLQQTGVAQSFDEGSHSVTDVLAGASTTTTDPDATTTVPETTVAPDTSAVPDTTVAPDPNATTIPAVVDPNATTVPATTLPPATTAAPATTAPPSGAATDVIAIGDSVMLGAAPALTAKGAVVDARQNRQGTEGAEIVEALAAAGQLPNVLVIHLGTNGPASQATLDRIITAAATVPFILVLTVRADRSWTADNNQRIKDLEVRYPGQVHLLDWATISNDCTNDCFYADNIHLKSAGQQFYADAVWAAIGRG